MKTKITLILLAFCALTANGQVWSGTTPGNIYYNQGNVGIGGMADPAYKLKVQGEIHVNRDYPYIQLNSSFWNSGSFIQNGVTLAGQSGGDYMLLYNPALKGYNFLQGTYNAFTIQPNGNVGVGVTNSIYKFAVQGEIHVNRDYPYVQLNSSYWNSGSYIQNGVSVNGQGGGDYLVLYNPAAKGYNFRQGTYNALTILPNGNLLIAKTSQSNAGYRLDVNGSIRANEIVVNTTGADFVFEENYKLATLDEIEEFIIANKHLPDIESATEMEKNGLHVGQIEMKLLQKIEELTLHMINLKKEITEANEDNKKLKEEIRSLKEN